MKIQVVSTDFIPNIGGVAQHVYELTRALQAMGHEVEVMTIDIQAEWKALKQPPFADDSLDIPVWRVPFVDNRTIKYFSGKLSFAKSDRRFCLDLLKRLGERKPDVVHWHAINSLQEPMTQWSGSANVWTNHTSDFILGLEQDSQRARYERILRHMDHVIAPSDQLRDLTRELSPDPDRVLFISNGIDIDRFSPEVEAGMWRERLKLKEGQRLVLCPRRLAKKNGVRYFIEAAVALLKGGLDNTIFAVAGDFVGARQNSEVQEVLSLIEQSGFGESVRPLGKIDNRDMPALYAAADIVVIPSLIEATSISCLEAMATGKPIIASKVGGLPQLLDHDRTGILLEPKRSDLLATEINTLLDDSEKGKRLGAAAREKALREFAWSALAEKVTSVYHQAIQHHASG